MTMANIRWVLARHRYHKGMFELGPITITRCDGSEIRAFA